MFRYLMTHSLLSSWLYLMKDNPYEDLTSERDSMEEFMQVLRREPTETTQAMQNGIDFEDLVTDVINGCADLDHKWFGAAGKVAKRCDGGILQYKAYKDVRVKDMDFLLYGRLDCLKAGDVIDIKFTSNYDVGKYFSSTQHPMYLELIPEAKNFIYLVSNGSTVWRETYRRDETPSIIPYICDFIDWLDAVGLRYLYEEKWLAM